MQDLYAELDELTEGSEIRSNLQKDKMGGLQEFLNTDQLCPLLNAFNAHCQIIDNAMERPTLYNKCANLQTPCVNVLKLGKYQFQCPLLCR